MGNQGRNDIENRGNDRSQGQSGSASGYTTTPPAAPPSSGSPGDQSGSVSARGQAEREDYYRRAQAARERGYRFDRERGERGGEGGYRSERGAFGGYTAERAREWETSQRPGSYAEHSRDYSPEWRERGQGSQGAPEAYYGDVWHPGQDYRRSLGEQDYRRTHGETGARESEWNRGAGMQQYGEMRGAPARGRRWNREVKRARDVMTRNPRTAKPTDSIPQISQIMLDEDTGIVPICEENLRLLGVVTDRDVVCRLIARGIDVRNARASEAMTDDVECATEQDSLVDVLRVMAEHQVRRVPVVARGDRLVGIISMSDIAREADLDEDLQRAFEEISSERGFWSRLR